MDIFFGNTIDKKVQLVVLGSMMKYWSAFIRSVQMEPNGSFTDPKNHAVVNFVYTGLSSKDVNISVEKWAKICSNVVNEFLVKKLHGPSPTCSNGSA